MKIDSVESFQVQLPTRRAHTWSGSVIGIGGFVLIKLRTDDGLVGLGEAPISIDWGGDFGRYYGESAGTVIHMIEDYLVPAIKGMSPFDIELIHATMGRLVKGHNYAKAAVDIACYDLMGKATNLPAHVFLGGAFRTEIRLAHSLGQNLNADEVEREAETVLDEGIKTLKLKVGADSERDVEAARRLRRLAGPKIEITVDANRGWDAKTAVRVIKRLEESEIAFVEQPVEGIERMAEVKSHVSVPIMADESCWTPQDVFELSSRKAADMISIYTTKPGGLHNARKVATACETVAFPANVNGSLETGVGNAANLHLIAACRMINQAAVVATNAPEGKAPTRVATHFYNDDIIGEPFGYRDGHILVPTGPGLGVELDPEKVQKYLVGKAPSLV